MSMLISISIKYIAEMFNTRVKRQRLNNNNNYKTSIAPISSKRIELSGAPSGGIGQTHSPGTMQSPVIQTIHEQLFR